MEESAFENLPKTPSSPGAQYKVGDVQLAFERAQEENAIIFQNRSDDIWELLGTKRKYGYVSDIPSLPIAEMGRNLREYGVVSIKLADKFDTCIPDHVIDTPSQQARQRRIRAGDGKAESSQIWAALASIKRVACMHLPFKCFQRIPPFNMFHTFTHRLAVLALLATLVGIVTASPVQESSTAEDNSAAETLGKPFSGS